MGKGKKITSLNDELYGLSYDFIEALRNTKANITFLESMEIDQVHEQLMGYLNRENACKIK